MFTTPTTPLQHLLQHLFPEVERALQHLQHLSIKVKFSIELQGENGKR
jgi:hypothetical protein